MSTVTVPVGVVHVPGMCVVCGSPAVLPATDKDKRDGALFATGTSQFGNTQRTESMWFPMCTGCAQVRSREKARKANYPGHVWVNSFVAVAFVLLAAALVMAGSDASLGSLPEGSFWASAIVGTCAVIAAGILAARNDRVNPPSEADRQRLADIAGAVRILPPGIGNVATIEIRNEDFAAAFAAMNPASPLSYLPGNLVHF